MLAIDETGFVKKGKKSAGVAPQYTATVGKIANCQIGVYLTYATSAGGVLIDRALYLPKEWSDDPDRLKEAGIAEESQTIPKPTMAKGMLEHAFAHGIKAAWVTGDTVYGEDYTLRSWLEEQLQPYVLAVPKNQRIGLGHRADEVIASLAKANWQRLSAGEGSQGPRFYDWIWTRLSFRDLEPGCKQWLLARRSISDPSELAYYLVFAPETVTLEQVVRAAGTRWRIEEDFELGKQQVGLDEYEVRKYEAWYRHQTLAMFALAFLTVLKVQAQKKGPSTSKKPSRFSR